MASVGKHIKRLRAARHMTQEQLAEKLFVTRQAVSAWETGKALPDVDTLERIAAALDADVTEVIYGARTAPDVEAMKGQWIRRGICWGILIAWFANILFDQGYFGSWTRGLAYQFGDPAYEVYAAEVPGSWPVELDLTDPYSNEGKILYEDGTGCRITVGSLDWNVDDDGAWVVWFTAEGACRRGRGTIVSGMMTQSDSPLFSRYATDETANMTVTIDGVSRPGVPVGDSFLDRNRKNFGYRLFYGPEDPAELPPSVTVTLEGLMRFTTVWSR